MLTNSIYIYMATDDNSDSGVIFHLTFHVCISAVFVTASAIISIKKYFVFLLLSLSTRLLLVVSMCLYTIFPDVTSPSFI